MEEETTFRGPEAGAQRQVIREAGGPHTLQVQKLDTQEKRAYLRKRSTYTYWDPSLEEAL